MSERDEEVENSPPSHDDHHQPPDDEIAADNRAAEEENENGNRREKSSKSKSPKKKKKKKTMDIAVLRSIDSQESEDVPPPPPASPPTPPPPPPPNHDNEAVEDDAHDNYDEDADEYAEEYEVEVEHGNEDSYEEVEVEASTSSHTGSANEDYNDHNNHSSSNNGSWEGSERRREHGSIRDKISHRLTKAVDKMPPISQHHLRSPELVPLQAEFEKMKKKLRTLKTVVKTYGEKTEKLNLARDELVDHLGLMSRDTPLHYDVGCDLDGEAISALTMIREKSEDVAGVTVMEVAEEWRNRNGDDHLYSLYAMQKLSSTQAALNKKEYYKHVVEYVVEWEKEVNTRVDMGLKYVRKLQADRKHYERKVDGLRKRAVDIEKKGKVSPQKDVEKLERNEAKLREAFTVHETEASRMCTLLEAVTRDGWVDLYFLIRNYMKWESNRVGRETDIYVNIANTLDSMKATYKSNHP